MKQKPFHFIYNYVKKMKTKKEIKWNLSDCDSSHILDMLVNKGDESVVKKALKKSAEYLIQTPEYDNLGNDYREIWGGEILMNIFETYLRIPRMIKDEAEKRARHKMAKLWKEVSKIVDLSNKNNKK